MILVVTFALAGPAVLPRRPAGHRGQLGPGRAGRLPGHRRQRARRHQRDRHVRAALQHQRQPAEDPVRPGELVRRDAADHQHRADVRALAAVQGRPDRPGAGLGAGHLQRRVPRPAAQVGDQLRQRGHQGDVQQRDAGGPRRQRRTRPGHAGHRADPGPGRRDRRGPAGPAPVLRHRLHQAAAVPRGRHVLRRPGHRHAPDRHPVGRHERDRQLPRPALAVAVPAVVPAARLPDLDQRGPDRHLLDRPGAPSCCWPSRSSPACATSPGGYRCTGSSGGTGTSRPPGPPGSPSPDPSPSPPTRSRPLRSGP